jgi:hypothetical protein
MALIAKHADPSLDISPSTCLGSKLGPLLYVRQCIICLVPFAPYMNITLHDYMNIPVAQEHFLQKASTSQNNKFSLYFLHGSLPRRQRELVVERFRIHILQRVQKFY